MEESSHAIIKISQFSDVSWLIFSDICATKQYCKNKFVLHNRAVYIKKSIILVCLLFPLLSSNSIALAPNYQQDTVSQIQAPFKEPVYTTQRLSTPPPIIDGKLDDECWKKGTWAGNYHQWMPE